MKNFIVLIVFVLTLLIGLVVSNLFGLPLKIESYVHRYCIYTDQPDQPLFTLEEVKPLLRKEVISKNKNYRTGETGRIMFLQATGKDKFMVAVYYGNGVKDDKSSLTFYNKKEFSEELEILD